jgi:hypothetical protein
LEPQAGIRAPNQHWSEIDVLDPAKVGDHKLVWELGRHSGLVTLAQAWWCTRDVRYANHCLALLESWLDANPPKKGVHWSSSLELSFRSIAWLWVLALLEEIMPDPLRHRLISHIAIAARHIDRHLSTWFSPNTHLTGEALGLFMIGAALPQCRESASWQQRGTQILLDWVDRHVRPDGTYVEQSTWYHRYTTDFYLQFLVLAERAGMKVRPQIQRALNGLLEYLMWLSRPDGTMPLIGDDDGGRLLFLDERTAHDTRTPLALGAALFRRGDFAAMAGAPSAELVWLLGPAGLTSLYGNARHVPDSTARAFPDGGSRVMRSGWDESSSMLVVDAGPHGFLNGGHAHADALSIDLTIRGRPVFVDPGTFTYTTSPSLRDLFRETALHCAVTVDGIGSATPAGAFQWTSRAESHCHAWSVQEDAVLFAGSHDGFQRLRPRIGYTRYIAFIRPDVWIIRDEITGEGEHELAVHWQCAPGLSCHGGAGSLTLNRGPSDVLSMRVLEHARWRFTEGWVSPTYGVRMEATHITCSRSAIGGASLTTVLSVPGTQAVIQAATFEGAPGLTVRRADSEALLLFQAPEGLSWRQTVRSPGDSSHHDVSRRPDE